MTNYLKKSLISVFLAICLFAVSDPVPIASALREDIGVQESVSADSTYSEDPMPVDPEPSNANDIPKYELIEKIDESAQSVPASAERGSDSYNINSGDVIIDIQEGDTCRLIATNQYGLGFTWTTTDFEVASVSSQGVLTAHKSGKVTITASFVQNGGTFKAQCTVYVYIDVGAFYVKNLSTGYYLHVQNGKIKNFTNVYQYLKYSDSVNDAYKIRQIWRIHYLGSGRYSLRPLHKLDMGLDVTGTNADIYKIGSVDTLASVPSYAEWEISWHINGYVLTNNGSRDKALQAESTSAASGANISVGTYSYTAVHRWVLERIGNPPKGVAMYNTRTGDYIVSAEKSIVSGETKTLSDLELTAVSYQTVSPGNLARWTSSNTSVAAVSSSSGAVTAKSCGKVTVTATANGKSTSYTLWVIPFHDGTYFLKNRETERYADIEDQIMSSGTQIHQWEFHGGAAQKWIFTYIGDGYYSIKSAHSSTPYYLGVSGDSTDNDVPIVLRTGNLTDGMKWRISVTSSGAYKLTPKTGEANNRVLAVGWYAANINGIDIEQRDYVGDENHIDEWHIVTPIAIGFSTDNYTNDCSSDERQSYRYANKFFDKLTGSPGSAEFNKIHHYNKDSNTTASKNDFAINGAISNDIDFMIYIGHGGIAEDNRGNRLHYSCAADGTYTKGDCANSKYNAYTTDMSFGSSSSDLRWVWLYTCNFLTPNAYVTDNKLKEMMTGAHIVMGYSSRATLCDAMAEKFASYLREGKTIKDAYFKAGRNGEASVASENHYQKIMYIPQAANETIYSPRIDYTYTVSDVIIVEKNIQDQQ